MAYTPEAWQDLEAKVLKGPIMEKGVIQFVRFFMSGAVDCQVDGQGRILIPPNLREHAFLNKDILFVGMMTWIELWDVGQWNRVAPQDGSQIDEMRQTMSRLGW
jgi:MraZ protein